MNGLSLGDLANSFMLQQRGSALKIEMARLTQELTSGQVSDVKNVVAGNYSYLTDIETGLLALKGHKIATTEASQFTGAMQFVLGKVQDDAMGFATDLITVSSGGLDSVSVQAGNEALEVLKSTIGALNTNIAGRSLFAGAATDTSPLASADDIMGELRTILAGVSGVASSKLLAMDNSGLVCRPCRVRGNADLSWFETAAWHPFDLSASRGSFLLMLRPWIAGVEGHASKTLRLRRSPQTTLLHVDVNAIERARYCCWTAGEGLIDRSG